MNDESAYHFSSLEFAAEGNILYLLEELDHALEGAGLAWTPAEAKVARRLVTSVVGKLGTIAAKL
jgi:hypothetical protein